jgi:hypothetical protein
MQTNKKTKSMEKRKYVITVALEDVAGDWEDIEDIIC